MTVMVSPSTGRSWLFLLQVVLISAGIFSIATALKASVIPLITEVSSSYLPLLLTSMLGWLKPPILYLIINGIIIIVAASSRSSQGSTPVYQQSVPDPLERVVGVREVVMVPSAYYVQDVYEDKPVIAVEKVKAGDSLATEIGGGSDADDEADVFLPVVDMDWTETRRTAKKSSISSKFNHRKSFNGAIRGGRPPKMRDTEQYETLEAAWKAINDERSIIPSELTSANKRLGRCDTWGRGDSRDIKLLEMDTHPLWSLAVMKESGTFNDRSEYLQLPPPSPVKLKKEPSDGVDELNRRVEAFIKKFNNEMRLQRQESLEHLKEMMNIGI